MRDFLDLALLAAAIASPFVCVGVLVNARLRMEARAEELHRKHAL